MIEIKAPFQYFTNRAGAPLEDGKIYIGQAGFNAETHPITVYWDAEGTIPAAQPIQTLGGVPYRNGSPARFYTQTRYSITVKDRNSTLVFSSESTSGGNEVSDIKQLISAPSPDDGETVTVISYHSGWQTSVTGPIGGGTFIYNSQLAKSLHNGGTIISNTVPWDGTVSGLAGFLAGTGETLPSGFGCWVRSGSGKEGTTSHFGAKVDGSANDYAATQKAVNTFFIVHVLPTGYAMILNTQVVIPEGVKFFVNEDVKVSANALTAGTPILKTESSRVVIKFKKGKGFDFNGYPNWAGVYASNSNDMIEDVHFKGGYHRNVGVDSTATFTFGMSGVRDGSMKEAKFYNCGVVSNVVGGGYVIYHDNCENMEVSGNSGKKVGSTFINSSCGLNNKHFKNNAKDVTLYPFKGGYGIGPTVSNHVVPTSNSFSVLKNGTALRTIKVGQRLMLPTASYPSPQGYVKTIADNGAYLTITFATASPATPTVGDQIQPLDTGNSWHTNSSSFCGDNAFDQNGVADFEAFDNKLDFSGWYQGAGVYAGLRAGIWVGYDPQGSINSMEGHGLNIHNNRIRHTYGSAILTVATNSQSIHDNELFEYNQGQDPLSVSPTYGGIDVCRTGYHRANDISIKDNRFSSASGYMVYAGFATRMKVTGNEGRSLVGIKCNTPRQLTLALNKVQTTGAGGYCYLISDDSGANPGSGAAIYKNEGYAEGVGGYVFHCTDTGFTALEVHDDNTWNCVDSTTIRYEDLSQGSSAPAYSGVYGNVGEKPVRFSLAAGQTIDLANYYADNGTAGGVIIEGFARVGTSAAEWFEVVFFGNVFNVTNTFTSKGSKGAGAFLATGDFTTQANTPNAGQINCRYTNNESSTVYMALSVKSISRM